MPLVELNIPESIPDTFRHAKMPRKAQREALARSRPLFQDLREKLGGAVRPMPSLSASREECFEWAGACMSWLCGRVETQPFRWVEPAENWNADVPAELRSWSRDVAMSRYTRDFTPSFANLVVCCGFGIGELLRALCPHVHWDVCHEPAFEPHYRLQLVNFRVGPKNGYDPRVNFYTCCLQSFVAKERDPAERVVEMMNAWVRGA